MKKGCLWIIAIFAVLWIIGTLTNRSSESDSNSDNGEVRPERALATRMNNTSFYYSEGSMNSSIQFTSENTGWFGTAILTQLGCRFVYAYNLEEDKIILTYTGSDCGRTSTDKIFYYDESKDHIYAMINGQKYVFDNAINNLTDKKLTHKEQEEQESLADYNYYNSEQNTTPDFSKPYSGFINNKYKIEMLLKNVSGTLSGNYRYTGKQSVLELAGSIDNAGNVNLKEYDNTGKNTGIFTGQLINNVLQGQWSTSDKQKTYSFSITEIQQEQSVYLLLQGKWQSDDDPKSFIMFDKYVRKDIYEGINEPDEEEYVLSDSCLNDLDKNPDGERDSQRYISLLKSDMCWHIDHIDNTSLSLVYMGRGNFLGYKRVE